MALKTKTVYICEECGFESPKWSGQCPSCRAWNTLIEENVNVSKSVTSNSKLAKTAVALHLNEIVYKQEHRIKTGISELDNVLGGGIVKGSVSLISGDPGIGKSTILLQICKSIDENLSVLYISGEESAIQLNFVQTG